MLAVAFLALLCTIGYLAYWWSYDRFWVRTDNAYVTGNLVPVAAQASGIVTQVLAEETQFVNRGDLMIRLDEHNAYAALGRARGRWGEEVRRIAALFMTRKQVAEKLSPFPPGASESRSMTLSLSGRLTQRRHLQTDRAKHGRQDSLPGGRSAGDAG